MDKLQKQLADLLNLRPFEECKTKQEKDSWYAEAGRVNVVLKELKQRGILNEQD